MYSFILAVMADSSDDSYKESIIKAYTKYYGYMAKIFSDMLPASECVDDCIQEVFLSILKGKINLDFSDEKKVKCYLRVCCKNQARDVLKELPRRAYEDLDDALSDEVASDPLDTILVDDKYRRLLETFEGMSEELKEVCYLKYLSELSVMDISKALGISANKVSERLNKAKRTLRIVMAEDFEV